MSNENLLRVLTVFDASEEAESLINALRNVGHIVRDMRVETGEDLQIAIEENPIDIILCKLRLAAFTARQALEALLQSGRDIPLVVVTPPGKETSALEVLKNGARDAVAEDQTERLKIIVKRELGDLRERRAARRCEQLLHETEKRAKHLIDSSRDAISYVHDGMHIYSNEAYLKMFGYHNLDEVQGMPIMDLVNSEDHAKLKEFLRAYAKGQTDNSQLDVHGQHTQGRKLKIKMEFSPASMDGEACTQIIIRDHSVNKELEQKINTMSQTDLVTGLFNRTYFLEHLDLVLARAVEGQVRGALFFILLDKYTEVRSQYGIAAADHFISHIASQLKTKLRDLGVLARFEAGSYTLLVQGIDSKQAEKYALGIAKLIAEHSADIGNQTSIQSTASLGLTLINETTSNSQECVGRAEKGAHMAHQEGGNRLRIFNPAMQELAAQEQNNAVAARIKTALKENKFRLMYQPIVSLHGEPGAHYEILLRMLDDKNEVLPPTEFLPAAQESGLMNYVDRWVIANAFMVLTRRQREGNKTRIFIKLSAASLCDNELLAWISDRIKTTKIDTDSLVFMLSEDAALNHIKQAKIVCAGLNELHCRVALENFGIEQNTFHSIKQLKVNYIKIHMSLIHALPQNVENQEKLKQIAEAASNQNIQTIAAFVEDANSLAVLWQCAVDFIEGYFLQQPATEMSYDFNENF
ncbi:MAG: EAL domain-containing protein [Gammaproteobacteria bacterium]|nr:EAL domain-containing protein [Gammaproteobacteria bacterium]